MAASPDSEATGDREAVPSEERLNVYRGSFVPGIYFSSGYSVWAFDFTVVPPDVEPFTYVWIITPDGERTLYADSEAAVELVAGFHDVPRSVTGTVTRDQVDPKTLRVRVAGDDGTELDCTLTYGQTTGTRVLNAVSALTPRAVVRTDVGAALGTMAMDRLLATNGTKVAGRTENGSPYRFEADRIHVVTDATATLNGEELGTPVPPDRPLDFGDVKLGDTPLYLQATAFLPIPRAESVPAVDEQ